MSLLVPVCFYPTRIIIIDDDPEWLNTCLRGVADQFQLEVITDPEEAIDRINANADLQAARDDIYSFQNIITNKNRFSIISAVICDFVLPIGDGIEVLKRVKIDAIKALVSAFSGVDYLDNLETITGINIFLSKGSIVFQNDLNTTLTRTEKEYFLKYSSRYLQGNKFLSKLLSSVEYAEIFDNVRESNSIIEAYLIDEHGSYLMVDANSKKYVFIVCSEIDAAKNRKKIAEQGIELQNNYFILKNVINKNYQKEMEEYDMIGITDLVLPAKKFTVEDEVYYYTICNYEEVKDFLDITEMVCFNDEN